MTVLASEEGEQANQGVIRKTVFPGGGKKKKDK